MRGIGFSATPVITREGRYAGIVSEGDLLWYLVEDGVTKTYTRDVTDIRLRDIIGQNKIPPVRITAAVEELFDRAMNQNFVPVVDDNDSFVGIITRKDIIRYFCNMSGMLKDSRNSGDVSDGI